LKGGAPHLLVALSLAVCHGAGAADGEAVIPPGLSSVTDVVRGAGGCVYRLAGFAVESHFVHARLENGCDEAAVFNLCLRDRGGNQSNRAKRVEGKRSAKLGLGHETTIPNQQIRWTVDEPACPPAQDAGVDSRSHARGHQTGSP
jgi:hypothetical protein